MTAVRCVDLQCDGCEDLYGLGFYETGDDVRAAARADGWRIEAMSKNRGTPRRDLCPDCGAKNDARRSGNE